MVQPKSQSDDLSDLGGVPVTPEEDDLSDLGGTSVGTEQDEDLTDLGATEVLESVEKSFPIATAIIKEGSRRLVGAAEDIATNPNMRALDPATKMGLIVGQATQSVFDESGERVAEALAYNGMNPYAAAIAGSVVQYLPDIAVGGVQLTMSKAAKAALQAAGNVKAESEILGVLLKRSKPLELPYKPPLEAPTTVLSPGTIAPLETKAYITTAESKGMALLKGEGKPKLLEGPKEVAGPGFVTRESPDLAIVQRNEALSGQPKYPEDIGRFSMKGYASKRKLSADIPEYNRLPEIVAEGDATNPAVSDLVDASRREYIGVDPRIKIIQDPETGQTSFRLRQEPIQELRTLTEPEVLARASTAESQVVKELDIDPMTVYSTPSLPGSMDIPVMKETVVAGSRGFIHDAWNRLAVSAENVVSKMGQAGTRLANGIRMVRDVPQVKYGEFDDQFNAFFRGMNKQQAKKVNVALSDALEGRTPDTKLPDGLLEFVQRKLKTIADEAESLGLTVIDSEGTSVPFAPRENYFPRVLREEIFDGILEGTDSNPNKIWKQLAQKMVENRQARSEQMAMQQIAGFKASLMKRRYGHLERAREVNLPPEFYDRNSLRVLPEYIRSALHRLEEVRQFGLKDEIAQELFAAIQSEGHDGKLARTIFERTVGVEPRDEIYLKGAQGLRNLTAGTLIQLPSTILQLGQVVSTAFETSIFTAVKSFAKAFTSLGESQAKRAGQVFSTAAKEYMAESYGGSYGFAGKFAENVMKVEGFARLDHFLRKYSAIAGRDYLENTLVPMILRNPSSKKAVTELQHLGFVPENIVRNKGLTDLELNVGAKRFADNVQGAPDVTRLPEFWTTWQGKLLGQFKNFSYLIGKQNASLVKRALETGDVGRLAKMSVGMPATGYIIKKLREGMSGESDIEITGQEDVDAAIQVIANATAFGPAVDMFFLAMQGQGKLANLFIPVSVKNLTEVAESAGKSIKEGDIEPLAKTLAKKTPVVGRILHNKLYGE